MGRRKTAAAAAMGLGGGGEEEEGEDEDDPLDAFMAGVSATASRQSAEAVERGRAESDRRGGGEDDDGDALHPPDACASGPEGAGGADGASGRGRIRTARRAERLDVENEEEATAHWHRDEGDKGGDGQDDPTSFPASARLLPPNGHTNLEDGDGSVPGGRGGGGGVKGTNRAPHAISAGASRAASSMASTFHRAGEKSTRPTSDSSSASRINDVDLDEDDLEESMRKRRKRAIDPLSRVDHREIQYEPFRKAFLEAGDTEAGERWRREQGVDCGPRSVDPVLRFEDLGSESKLASASTPREWSYAGCAVFPPELSAAVSSAGYASPTVVQSQALPVALSGQDCLVTASTGSGKTIAYALPLVVHCCDQREIVPGVDGPIGIVLTPTRELAKQVYGQMKRMLRSLGGHAVCVTGGEGKYEMTKELKKGCEVVVSTPGRLIDMVRVKGTNLRRVTMVVLDEADKMLHMGFEKQVTSILDNVRLDRHTLMFSATFGRRVERVANRWLRSPVR